MIQLIKIPMNYHVNYCLDSNNVISIKIWHSGFWMHGIVNSSKAMMVRLRSTFTPTLIFRGFRVQLR